MYTVKEIFRTVQGEGGNLGRDAIFLRFSGCNLWSGREKDRSTAICRFCDTNFVGGDKLSLEQLVTRLDFYGTKFVVVTGGEPTLQYDAALDTALHAAGYEVAIETNGTYPVVGCDFITVSPKAGTLIVQNYADELKLVWPQNGMNPEDVRKQVRAKLNWLSPMDGPNYAENVKICMEYISSNPGWRLNIQAHKFWSVP